MLPYSYLILGVNPTSNEASVNVNTKITITFAKSINKDTLNSNTIRVRKVNGDFIEYTGRYNYQSKAYEITPNQPLEPNTQYQTIVLGGMEGVVSVDNGYLPSTKTYEFVTIEQSVIPNISNLELKQDYLFVSVKWGLPSGLNNAENIFFNVRLSTSNNPEATNLWPKNSLEGKTSATELTIPYRLETGQNYYVHVQGISDSKKTEWVTGQIYMEPIESSVPSNPSTPSAPEPISQTRPVSVDYLSIVDYSPKIGELTSPAEILVIFNQDVSAIEHNLFYVVQAPYKKELSLIDQRGAYSPSKAVAGEVLIDLENPNLVIWTPTAPFESGKEYTVILSRSITGVDSSTLGFTHTLGFTALPQYFYGNLDQIKEVISSYGLSLSDRFLQNLMKKYSQFAIDVWSTASTYDESLLQNGEAPYYINEYVNTQVLIDSLINGGSPAMAGGNESIKLGDLTVTKSGGEGGGSASITDMIAQLQKQLKTWTDLIHGHHNRGYARPGSTVKGEAASSYPDYLTRSTLVDPDA